MQVIKKFALYPVLLSSMAMAADQGEHTIVNPLHQLQEPPSTTERFYEIATQYNPKLPELWNSLSPEERIFAYYMMRASAPGNRIKADQTHKDAVEIIALFTSIIRNQDQLRSSCSDRMNVAQFLAEAELFLTYLFAHHGQYFLKEYADHKRTPARLNLMILTPDTLVTALQALDVSDASDVVARLHSSIFDAMSDPTVTVDGSIEQSAGNMYSADFTQSDFDTFDPMIKAALNAYFYIEQRNGVRTPQVELYKIGGKYSQELEVAYYWLTKAYLHASKYQDIFDEHIAKSLGHMLDYLQAGDEEHFKRFSTEWLKTHSRIDFNFGFIETYCDPLHYRGSFEAEVTIKTVDMQKLNALLPTLEQGLPFPQEFKRQNLDDVAALPNASVNAKIFASGDAGPVKITAAYCLPNYRDIRTHYGSKQIIYQRGKALSELSNPHLSLNLFNAQEHVQWLLHHDPDMQLDSDLWDVQVILHETLGHGSGRGTAHIFVDGDPLTIGGKIYAVGDTILVTSENSTEFLGKYANAFEELRAEIIALYSSIYFFDELADRELYKEWPTKIGKEKLIEWSLLSMGKCALRRLLVQQDDATEIVQAHAQADTAILNYLIDHGGLELIEEMYRVEDKQYTVIDVRVVDVSRAMKAVKDLACEVQRCTSTADGLGVEHLMKRYGTCVRHPEYIKIMKENRAAVQGDLKEVAEIFPRLLPVYDDNETIIDVAAQWPNSFLQQQLELYNLALSCIEDKRENRLDHECI